MPVTIPRTELVWQTNTPCSNGWGELCSLMTASLAGPGSHCQGHCSCHSDWSWGRSQSSASPQLKQEQLGQSLLPAAQTLSTHGWPRDHLAIAALYRGCFRKAISKLIFLEARSLITWLEMSPAFQPELPAKQPPPRAGMNRNRPS